MVRFCTRETITSAKRVVITQKLMTVFVQNAEIQEKIKNIFTNTSKCDMIIIQSLVLLNFVNLRGYRYGKETHMR